MERVHVRDVMPHLCILLHFPDVRRHPATAFIENLVLAGRIATLRTLALYTFRTVPASIVRILTQNKRSFSQWAHSAVASPSSPRFSCCWA